MSQESRYKDYEDIVHLLKTDEWRAWLKFLDERVASLKEKVLKQVNTKEFDGAMKTEAIIGDIRKQVDAFRRKKTEYENQQN